MSRKQLLIEIRYRLVVLALMGAVLVPCSVALRNSVRLGSPPPYDAPYMHPYVGAVTVWRKGESGLGGWVENQTDRACASMGVWVQANEMDDFSSIFGPVAVTNGFVALGRLRAHQRTFWAGQRIDLRGRDAPLSTPPLPDPSFACYRNDPS